MNIIYIYLLRYIKLHYWSIFVNNKIKLGNRRYTYYILRKTKLYLTKNKKSCFKHYLLTKVG